MIIIGDVHAKKEEYAKIIADNPGENTFQVGDFGFQISHDWHLSTFDSSRHKVVFGNHDYYPYLDKPHSCGNFSYFPEYDLMTIRGAGTIDGYRRVEGYDWFPEEEEMSYGQWYDCIDMINDKKPKIIISHDCPMSIAQTLFGFPNEGSYKSPTRNGLQACWDNHKPEMWFFGHHHESKDVVILGTRFICLNELEIFKI